MKITKLYTLSQFVIMLNDNATPYFEIARLVIKYTYFLLQPIKKEMFVNELEEPIPSNKISRRSIHFKREMDAFQQSEKKVIFKKLIYPTMMSGSCGENGKNTFIPAKTLNEYQDVIYCLDDLSEATNGELETKNIKI